MQKIAKVVLDLSLYRAFDYAIGDNNMNIVSGMRVEVPFGSKQKIGIVTEVLNRDKKELTYKIKNITKMIDAKPIIDSHIMHLCKWSSEYYQYPLGQVLFGVLPTKLKKGSNEYPYKENSSDEIISKTDIKEKIILNNEQKKIYQDILINKNNFNVNLIEGITGSGKTEVYIKLAKTILNTNGQILILVPEINLTPQTVSRFKNYLDLKIASFHSSLTEKNKFLLWDACKKGKIDIIIGTRSAIFLPFKKLKMIIVDEEHDSSLKQVEKFKYHARDIALVRAQKLKIPVVLGSATPSFESIYNSNIGKYNHMFLKKRYHNTQMPSVTVVDLNKDTAEDSLSATLVRKIKKELDRGGQTLVFVNRRGFSSGIMCKSCGWISKCKKCDAHMTYHKNNEYLQCHHCGYTEVIREMSIRECNTKCDFVYLGTGTERIEKKLKKIFPSHNIIRVDSDSINTLKKLEEFRQSCIDGDIDIIVGTQMLVKGHDFPNLNLVAVVNIDSALFSHDFRSTEKISQQLVQVAGRSGRKSNNSEVVIQTRVPNHPLITELLKKGYSYFSTEALRERKKTNLPPFSFMSLLRVSSSKKNIPQNLLEKVARMLSEEKNVIALGPAPAPIIKKNNMYIYQLIIQSNNRKLLLQKSSQIREYIIKNKKYNIRWSLDVDPIDLY